MKKTISFLVLLVFVAGAYAQKSHVKAKNGKAKVTVTTTRTSRQVKTHGPPSWAPAHGYRAKTRHIYFPNHNFYFDLQRNVYIYMSGRTWRVSTSLPSILVGIDLRRSPKVELELTTDRPQAYNARHKKSYRKHR